MAEQTYANHAHRSMLFNVAVLLWTIAVVAVVYRRPADWIVLAGELAVLATLAVLIWTSRAYAVRLQDRIIMLEMKVRTAELLPAGEDARMTQLTKAQIIALRFASDDELADLLDRAIRDKLSSKEIKMAIRNWKPDHLRT